MQTLSSDCLVRCFAFLRWEALRTGCGLVCRAWAETAERHLAACVADVQCGDATTVYDVCSAVCELRQPHVVLRTGDSRRPDDWGMLLLRAALDTVIWHRQEEGKSPIESLWIHVEHRSALNSLCDSVIEGIIGALSGSCVRRASAVHLRLPWKIPFPTFSKLVESLVRHDPPLERIDVETCTAHHHVRDVGWRILFQHLVGSQGPAEWSVVCGDDETSAGVLNALQTVVPVSGACPVRRCAVELRWKHRTHTMKLKALWNLLHALRSQTGSRLRELRVVVVGADANVSLVKPMPTLLDASTTPLHKLTVNVTRTGISVVSLVALLRTLGPARSVNLNLTDNGLPSSSNLWNPLLSTARSLTYRDLRLRWSTPRRACARSDWDDFVRGCAESGITLIAEDTTVSTPEGNNDTDDEMDGVYVDRHQIMATHGTDNRRRHMAAELSTNHPVPTEPYQGSGDLPQIKK